MERGEGRERRRGLSARSRCGRGNEKVMEGGWNLRKWNWRQHRRLLPAGHEIRKKWLKELGFSFFRANGHAHRCLTPRDFFSFAFSPFVLSKLPMFLLTPFLSVLLAQFAA